MNPLINAVLRIKRRLLLKKEYREYIFARAAQSKYKDLQYKVQKSRNGRGYHTIFTYGSLTFAIDGIGQCKVKQDGKWVQYWAHDKEEVSLFSN